MLAFPALSLRFGCDRALALLLLCGLLSSQALAKVWELAPSPDLEHAAQEALLLANEGDVVLLPEGRFEMSTELSMIRPSVTLRGRGMDKTILVYGQAAAGPQAIIASARNSRVEDLTILDHPGDGIKMIGVQGAQIRRVKVEWQKKAAADNGAYGLYPVLSSDVLIEDSVVIGASDAGIYVGQSQRIIVRRNLVEGNVAGIEIENSQLADVYENRARFNTGGILVFNLPHLLLQGGRGTRLFKNTIEDNNLKNFAPKGNSVAAVPAGTGILVLANDDIEIFENSIANHNTTSIALVSYHILQQRIEDPHFDAMPENIFIHHNKLRNAGRWPISGANQLGLIAGALSFPHRVPHIAYDGIGALVEGEAQPAVLEGTRRICLDANDHDGGEKSYFGNLQLWKEHRWSPLPGSMLRALEPHRCQLPRLEPVVLEEAKPQRSKSPLAEALSLSPEETAKLCSGGDPEEINWAATKADCPQLADYRLFSSIDPALEPRKGGYPYELTTPLFSDYAHKSRFLFLPPGQSAGYQEASIFNLPLGTVIAKTFAFPLDAGRPDSRQRLIETRLLIRGTSGWRGLVYLWNAQGQGARLVRGGSMVSVAWIDGEGKERTQDYHVPNLAQCEGCHIENQPIGLKAGYLNRAGLDGQDQLELWAKEGRLRDLPAAASRPRYPVWDDPKSGSLEARARTYLDINCAHCHSLQGKANTSALFLTLDQATNIRLGICKPPVAAGRGTGGTLFDIVPGRAAESLLVDRMKATNAAVKMPELARFVPHQEGIELVSEWIDGMKGSCEE